MKLVGIGYQRGEHHLYDASGTLSGSTPVLVLPRQAFRSALFIQNTGSSAISVDFGYARAGAVTMSGTFPNQSVASVAVANAGQGYTRPPVVTFFGGGSGYGGGLQAGVLQLGVGAPGEDAPSNAAQAHCVMTGSAPNQTVSSIAIDNPGSGYACAPLCFLSNDPWDPNGCVAAAAASSILLAVGSAPLKFDASVCPTTPVVIVGTNGGTYSVKYMV